MRPLKYSFIVPVYNRPEEIDELLHSINQMHFEGEFEVVIVEDGSQLPADEIIEKYRNQFTISYYSKSNTGPGDSRNFGMRNAKGNYFIILDSDCVLTSEYLNEVDKELQKVYVDCFGGPDAASTNFTNIQKAINYAMTSVFTTGGIRGKKQSVGKFQPRSFNMGISKEAFEKTKGFGLIHPGEDPDLTFRIWKSGYQTRLFSKAFVYHKRRIDWRKFYKQVHKFGMVRPILNKWHPNTAKITYWFPTIFIIGLFATILLALSGFTQFLIPFVLYFGLIFTEALLKNKSLGVAFLAIYATLIQFIGYGWGFLKSTCMLFFVAKTPEELFPQLFFKVKSGD